MRFVFAIIFFTIAAGMILFGIAERTVLAEPDQVLLSTTVTTDSAVTVVDGATLNAFDGSQTILASGSTQVVAAYGLTSDVLAWIGDTDYTEVTYDSETESLTSELVSGAETTVPDPAGSDLWFDDFTEEGQLRVTVNVPDDVSFIFVSDGTEPAPNRFSVSWPLDNSTPWAGPLIVGGAVVLIIGLGMLLWATNHMRSGRGPRRKPQKLPKVPRKRALKPPSRRALGASAGGRRRGMIAVPIVLVGALALSGCSSDLWLSLAVAPTPSATSTDTPDDGLEPPAATQRQVERIVARISELTATADADLDKKLIATRFDGAALQLRLANYTIRKADPAVDALPAIPEGPIKVTLPQQTSGWPRVVFAVIHNEADTTVPPVALLLEQADPRALYKVTYAITLEPSTVLPDMAPADVGASRLATDSALLKLTPTDTALAYADILETDEESASYADFEAEGDSLRLAVGLAAKEAIRSELPTTASVEFGHAIGSADPIALATNDAGAIVAVNLNETTTVAPVEAGAAVNPTGQVKALSGISVSTKGVIATYGDQLLFYIPPAGSNEKIVLLGYSQGLVTAKELG